MRIVRNTKQRELIRPEYVTDSVISVIVEVGMFSLDTMSILSSSSSSKDREWVI